MQEHCGVVFERCYDKEKDGIQFSYQSQVVKSLFIKCNKFL